MVASVMELYGSPKVCRKICRTRSTKPFNDLSCLRKVLSVNIIFTKPVYSNSVATLQKPQRTSIIIAKQCTQFKEIITVYWADHLKHMNIGCGQTGGTL